VTESFIGHKHEPETGDRVLWRTWGIGAFEDAQEQDRPVLLSIGATWCYWCHVMDDTTYLDADVVDFINQNFTPIKVDNDHRPDVNSRYNVGGWPTTAFLTPHGGLIGGATYLPPDQLLAMVTEVQRAYQEQKPQLYEQGNGLLRERREQAAKVVAAEQVDQVLVDRISRRVVGTYDALNGGFGEELKFPGAPILQFLIHMFRLSGEQFYRVILEKTLDHMVQGELFDQQAGGFFRYCAAADWSEAQHEKLLEDNLSLARVYMDAYLILGRDEYRQVSSRTIDFMLDSLFDEDAIGFKGSQGAHSDYFSLSLDAREHEQAPPKDPFCYTSWSAQAASVLLEASWKLDRPESAATALSILDKLDAEAQDGHLRHTYDSKGFLEQADGDLLVDWAALLNGLVDAYNQTVGGEHYLERAVEVANQMVERFGDVARGAFYDVEAFSDAPGYMKVREKPLPENILAVFGLLKLSQATLNEEYLDIVGQTLSAYVEANRGYGEFAASYALAVSQFLSAPVEITIEGSARDTNTMELVKAAARVSEPFVIIKPALSFEAGNHGQAHVCLNTVCLPPVHDPSKLAETVATATSGQQQSPFENIFERFPGL